MKMLKKVRIDTVYYSIVQEDKLILNGRVVFGCIDCQKKIIKINPDISEEQEIQQTLWHEIVHGIIHERNFDFIKTEEETIVNELSKGIYQVILDNPEIFKKNNEDSYSENEC